MNNLERAFYRYIYGPDYENELANKANKSKNELLKRIQMQETNIITSEEVQTFYGGAVARINDILEEHGIIRKVFMKKSVGPESIHIELHFTDKPENCKEPCNNPEVDTDFFSDYYKTRKGFLGGYVCDYDRYESLQQENLDKILLENLLQIVKNPDRKELFVFLLNSPFISHL